MCVMVVVVILLDDTWDKKLAMYLSFSFRLVSSYCNHLCSVQLYFCQNGMQPNISFILEGTGKRIIDVGKKAYVYYVLVFW